MYIDYLAHVFILHCLIVLVFSIVCTGGVRLTGGITAMDGQVDVCVDGTYSSVCTSGGWSVKEASIVCRQLGLPTG